MAYIGILLSRFNNKTHVVSEVLGLYMKKTLQKRIIIFSVCQGKPLECSYYKDWGADSVVIEWLISELDS